MFEAIVHVLGRMTPDPLPFPNDSGPIYRETLPGRLPVEPFNTFSNLIFLVLIVYWGRKVFARGSKQDFLKGVIPVIALSLVGGMMFHGTRSHEFWLVLDWLPILLLSLALVIYMIAKLTPNIWGRLLIFLGIFALSLGLRFLPFPDGLRISLGYTITAFTISAPLLVYLWRTRWRYAGFAGSAVGVFLLAVYFRSIDRSQQFFEMGTHWVWHLLGGVAVHLLITFVYKDREAILEQQPPSPSYTPPARSRS